MSSFRSALIVGTAAACGAAGAFAVGSIAGMSGGDLLDLLLLLLLASVVTSLVSVALARLMRETKLRHRLVVLSVLSVVIAAANVGVLARLMFVSAHDGLVVIALLLFASGAGIGVALSLTASTSQALERVTKTARALGSRRLEARVGDVGGGPELTAIARALDDMADDLQVSLEREHVLEERRRDLISAVSHDLRTPLASLRAMIEAIDDGVVQDPPSLRRYAREMRGSVGSLVELVDDLFELVKLDATAIETEAEQARLVDVVNAAVATCIPQAETKELRVASSLAGVEDVPCSTRMVRVLQNLLTNAIRHTPTDGSVMIDATLKEGGLSVTVSDTGEGIRGHDLTRVFEPFWRGDKARRTDGSGLGLALAQRIVESLNGTIEVRSELGSGSSFSVWVPVREAHAE
jgi:signal transduction histidine kinase